MSNFGFLLVLDIMISLNNINIHGLEGQAKEQLWSQTKVFLLIFYEINTEI